MGIDRVPLGVLGEDLVQLPEQGEGSKEWTRNITDGREIATLYGNAEESNGDGTHDSLDDTQTGDEADNEVKHLLRNLPTAAAGD